MLRLFVLGLLVLAGCGAPAEIPSREAAPASTPRFEADSVDFPIQVPSAFRSTTGYLVVPEDRRRPNGRTIRLPVAIVHPREGGDTASPVLYLSGGPGTTALSAAAYPGAYPWTQDRPFVVLGQRGTGYAQPALECPEVAASRGWFGPDDDATARQVAAAEACRARLEAEGVDLAAYSTAASAADIEDLRQVLGVGQWTLYGISYGTRLGLAVLRDHPETVRAAVFDSVLPPQVRYDDESARNAEAAIRLVLRDCAASAGCRDAYPDLGSRLWAALGRADADPVRVSVEVEGDLVDRDLRGADVVSLIDLSSPSGIAAAPRQLDAIARRDTSRLAPLVSGGPGASSLAWGMRLSVWCGEALPFADRAQADGPGPTLGGLESAVVRPEVCAAWGVPTRPASEVEPVESGVPTLLLAGEYDPLTPPRWAEAAAETLPMSRVVVVRGGGHTPTQHWGGDGCAMRIAAAFVADPGAVVGPAAGPLPCLPDGPPPVFQVPGEDG